MAANDLQVVTIIVPNPEFDPSSSARIVNSGLGFSLRVNRGFQTLSSNNPNRYEAIEGLLYVPSPTGAGNDTCADVLSTLPSNITTLADLPQGQQYPLTAFFPWTTNQACTEAFLAQARADAVQGVFTYQPGRDAPSSSDDSWNLRDGSSWQGDNQFPIYALDGDSAGYLVTQLSLYSGNMTQAPNGPQLAMQFDSRDFPRLFAHVGLQGQTSVPSLWIFLIIVLAILLGIVILASVVMHIIQRHQRRALQRRLERGEIDLESLGIKKMNVPAEMVEKMPKYTYTDSAAPAVPPVAATKSPSPVQHHATSFSQTTCPVCLDDFVAGETEVRELPCKHIFHPECIDLFLQNNSSLCPMCKQSALPAGYCPVKVTNLMVRRERLVRRMRERRRQGQLAAAARAAAANGDTPPPPPEPTSTSWLSRLRPGHRSPAPYVAEARRANGEDVPAGQGTDIELGAANDATANSTSRRLDTRRQTVVIPADIAAQGAAARRAWRRERLARMEEEAYNQQAETARNVDVGRPLWRRVAGRIVPGLD